MNTDLTKKEVTSSSCYEFILFDHGGGEVTPLPLDTIDATYVVYLEGNQERYEQVVEQLKQIQPTKTIWIVHNPGYKNCYKSDYVTSPPTDIVHTNLTIFQHANDHQYRSILVLEDDFLFDERLHSIYPENKEICHEISQFLQSWDPNSPLIYYLGTLPIVQCPIRWSHSMVFLSAGSHAVIYNQSYRNMLLKEDPTKIKDWDIWAIQYYGNRYTYRIPLCYQLFPSTENSEYWGYQDMNLGWLSKTFHFLNKMIFGLDKKIEPGYSFYNIFSKILFFFFCFLFLFLIFKFIHGLAIIFYWIIYYPIHYLFSTKKTKRRSL